MSPPCVGDEYFVTAGEPIVERLFARKVARQSVGFPAADGRFQDAPDGIMVARLPPGVS